MAPTTVNKSNPCLTRAWHSSCSNDPRNQVSIPGGIMKKLAFVLYTVSILLISGLSRANAMTLTEASAHTKYQSPVTVVKVTPDLAHLDLRIDGSVPNPCYGQPAAMMTQDAKSPDTLIVRLSSTVPMDQCIWKMSDVTTVVALPLLAQASQLQLEEKALYLIKVEGSDFEMQVTGTDLLK